MILSGSYALREPILLKSVVLLRLGLRTRFCTIGGRPLSIRLLPWLKWDGSRSRGTDHRCQPLPVWALCKEQDYGVWEQIRQTPSEDKKLRFLQ